MDTCCTNFRTALKARSQALSEIFERHIKYRIIREGWCLPEVPDAVIARYPGIAAGIRGLREAGLGILLRDPSLGVDMEGSDMHRTLLAAYDKLFAAA